MIYKIPRYVADRTLFLSFSDLDHYPNCLAPNRLDDTLRPNLLILGYPGQGKTAWVKKLSIPINEGPPLPQSSHFLYMNLREKTGKDWETWLNDRLEEQRIRGKFSNHCNPRSVRMGLGRTSDESEETRTLRMAGL